MSEQCSKRSKFRSWLHRDRKAKEKGKQPEESLAICGSCASRSSVHGQVLTAPAGDTEVALTPPSQRTPVPVSHVQVPQKPPNHSQLKPYADNEIMWDEALNSLQEKEKCVVELLTDGWVRDGAKRGDLVGEIQRTMDETLKSNHYDRSTSIGKLLSVLNKFLSAGDVAVSFDPAHAALPWAAVRSLIVVFTAHNELKGVVLTGMADVISLLVQCDIYQLLYMVPGPTLRPPEDFLARLRTCIVMAYAGLQSFLAFADRQKRSLKLGHVFKLEDARAHIDKLSSCQNQLLQAANDCEKSCDLSIRSDLKELLGLSLEIPMIRQQLHSVLERIDARDELKLREWISPIQYNVDHLVWVESRTPNTCEWLLQTKEFHEWMKWGSSAILTLQGSIGAGKTYLTSKVIDHVQGVLESVSDHTGFAFFYCDRTKENRSDPLCVLRSYVRQLSTAVGSTGHIRKRLRTIINETRLQGSHLGFEVCKSQLIESVNDYSQTVIILDALDECDDSSRYQLIDVIRNLVFKSDRPLKVFISSRPDNNFTAQFSGKNIRIEAKNNQDDIERFVKAEIAKPREWEPISADLQSKVVQTLCKGSNGMFQWASLQIKQVLELSTPEDIEIRLGKLPETLETAYEEIYDKIAKSPHQKALVDRACKWVMSACTPLNSDELFSAVYIDADGTSINSKDQMNESKLLRICSNLLVLDPQTQLWRFSHLSVHEYFERNYWGPRETHSHAAKVCLKLLIETYKNLNYEIDMESSGHGNDDENPNQLRLVHPLGEYVQQHWGNHIRLYERTTKEGQIADPSLACLLKRFLGSPSKSSSEYRAWWRYICSTTDTSFLHRMSPWIILPVDVTIFVMCHFRFYILLQDWWDTAELAVSQTNLRGQTPLEIAAMVGFKPICEALIKRVMTDHLMLPEHIFGKAVVAAADKGYSDIAELIVGNEANLKSTISEEHYNHALRNAASCGSITTLRVLIEARANMNSTISGRSYERALTSAAREGNTKTVKFLIENASHVRLPLPSRTYGGVLAAVVAVGSGLPHSSLRGLSKDFPQREMEIVKILIENGADVNIPSPSGGFGRILAAAGPKRLETWKVLVKDDVKDEVTVMPSWPNESALATAASHGKIEIVKVLIKNGADVNLFLPGGDYGSALAAAAAGSAFGTICPGRKQEAVDIEIGIVKILIENGADVNAPLSSGKYGSALAAAVCKGKIEIVKALIESGADVNLPLRTGRFGSALAATAHRGDKEIEKILVDKGATMNPDLLN